MFTSFLQSITATIGDHATAALFIVFAASMGEALFVVGLFVPSTVVLVGAGTLIGMGKLAFLPIFLSSSLGAIAGDAISYWVGHRYRDHIRKVWPFSRYTGLLDKGEAFFAAHGGKSVFFGRFIPAIKSVVPGIAGIAGMDAWRFTLINAVSAFAWAAAHILPGMGIGRAADVAGRANPRMLEVALLIAGMAALIWYLGKFAVLWAIPHLSRWHGHVLERLAGRTDRSSTILRRLLVNEDRMLTAFVLAILALAGVVLAVSIAASLLIDPELVRSDAAISGYVQSLRTPMADSAMTAITMLGDGAVLAPVAVALISTLVIMRHGRMAAMVTAAVIGATLFVPLIKTLVQRSRPMALHSGADAYSFPSGHATLSATILGALILVTVLALPRRYRFAAFIAGATSVMLIAFSRIYLLAHWPSDVLAGLSFGTSIILVLGWLLLSHSDMHVFRRAAQAGLVTLMIAYPAHLATGFAAAHSAYAVPEQPQPITADQWITQGWQALPDRRILLDGEFGAPFIAQTDLDPAVIEQGLSAVGWARIDNSQTAAFAHAVIPTRTGALSSAVMPMTHQGRPASMVFVRVIPTGDGEQVLRLWSAGLVTRPDGATAPVFLIGYGDEIRDPLGFGFLLPETRQADADARAAMTLELGKALAAPGIRVIQRNDIALIAHEGGS